MGFSCLVRVAIPAVLCALPNFVVAQIGSLGNDLSFTAITPCRIVDTRLAGGPISANGTRTFFATLASAANNFSSQGGSATDCQIGGVAISGVAVNVTVVNPSVGGYTTVYKAGTTRPTAASVNYTAGQIVNNSVMVGIPNPRTGSDFTIFSLSAADYVVDIVGYYAPPVTTLLQCTSTTLTSFPLAPNSSNYFNNPDCPAGYRAVTPYCYSGSTGVYSQGSGFVSNDPNSPTFCAWANTNSYGVGVLGGNVCCRIPGR